jgi:hypothetical protein
MNSHVTVTYSVPTEAKLPMYLITTSRRRMGECRYSSNHYNLFLRWEELLASRPGRFIPEVWAPGAYRQGD